MVINDLITKLNAQHFYTIGYADDLTILIQGRLASTVCDLTQTALQIVERWCTEYDLTVNPNKTELVMFTLKRNISGFRLPKLQNTELHLSEEVKYLGVILDKKLTWTSHLESKIERSGIILWQCRRMIGKQWGLAPKIILWLYKMVIRPLLCYGAIVWWPKVNQTTSINKLQKFQRLACLATTGGMRTTPTAAMEVILDLPPLHLYIKQEATMTAIRLKTLDLWTANGTPHTTCLNEVYEEIPILMAVHDKIPKQFIFDKKYKIQLVEDKHLYDGLNQKELRIFTDGSKTSSGTGTGVFSEDLNISISEPLGIHNTVFQAECMGILLAATAIAKRKVSQHSIRILSDSMAALQALGSATMTSGLVYNCYQLLSKVSQHNNIILQWIKGHSGSRGNDAADELARRGSDAKAVGPEPIIPIPFNQIRSLLKQRTRSQHTSYWKDHRECRQAKEALPETNSRLSQALLRLNKNQMRTVTSALTGHGSFNKHLFVLGITDSPLCRACMEADETAAHILLECTGVAQYRAQHLGTPRSLSEIVSNPRSLLRFFGELGWLE